LAPPHLQQHLPLLLTLLLLAVLLIRDPTTHLRHPLLLPLLLFALLPVLPLL
jgi:hypothetical protein